MAGLDQAAWQKLTAWQGRRPKPADALEILGRVDVGSFRDALDEETCERDVLRAGYAQRLRADRRFGADLAAIREGMHADLQYRPAEATLRKLLALPLRPGDWNNRFANLVSGRFTELLFEHAHEQALGDVGLDLNDATSHRSFIDYTITGEAFEVSVNVKNAGVQYAMAEEHVGLASEDTIPMATYKTFGAARTSRARPPLVHGYP